MSEKKKASMLDMGDMRKPLRDEPETAPKKTRLKRIPLFPFSTRLTEETLEQISDIADREGWTVQEVIKQAVGKLHSE